MKCQCTKNCIKNKEELLTDIETLYESCPECDKKTLKKAIPLKNQIKLENLDKNYKKCNSCKKRHIDIVIAHALKILIEEDQISPNASIRKIGTPLITPAIYLEKLPYLSENTLVLITKKVDKKTSQRIINEVPEVKAVIMGDVNKTVGIKTEKSDQNDYELMAGCDIRCDIQNTDTGPIPIYKAQSKIHIEYPKKESPKITQINNILNNYNNVTIIDAFSGPGTLGIYALSKNAKKVIFNDINKNAVDALKVNFEVNNIDSSRYEIYNEDIHKLPDLMDEKYDIALLDTFPDVETKEYEETLKKIAKKVIVI